MKPILLCATLLISVLIFTSYRKEKKSNDVLISYTEYKVIEEASLHNLEVGVNYHLNHLGYKPVGGVSYSDGKYRQAVVKEN
jgi:hypothetical protein